MTHSTNVRPGDRAIIVSANYPENLGKVVDVIREYVPGEVLPGHRHEVRPGRPGVLWVVESLSGPFYLNNVKRDSPFRAQVCAGHDDKLRRLEPPEDEQTDLGTPVEDSQAVTEGVGA